MFCPRIYCCRLKGVYCGVDVTMISRLCSMFSIHLSYWVVMTAHLCYSDAGDDTHCCVISKFVDVEISLQSDGYMLLFLQFSFPKYARSCLWDHN
jgi:hypothetical protein